MPKAPDGTVVNELSSDDDTGGAVSGAEKEDEGHGDQTQSVVRVPIPTRNAILGPLVP